MFQAKKFKHIMICNKKNVLKITNTKRFLKDVNTNIFVLNIKIMIHCGT